MSTIQVPISFGELIDKITILEIKSEKIQDPAKLENVRHELKLLTTTWQQAEAGDVTDAWQRLKQINLKLWAIEDDIRIKESVKAFDDDFIALARAVYVTNDQRAEVKKEINLALGSELVEEKSYQDYS